MCTIWKPLCVCAIIIIVGILIYLFHSRRDLMFPAIGWKNVSVRIGIWARLMFWLADFFGWYWLITDTTVLVYTFWKWLFFTGNYAKKEAWCISYLLNPQWSLSCQCTDVSFNKTVYCQTVKDPALITYLWSISFRRSPLKKVYGILYF